MLDQRGVGELVKIATERGRKARPNLKVSIPPRTLSVVQNSFLVHLTDRFRVSKQVGICGEHGGEPSSVAFFAKAGLDYVSCSPFRLAEILKFGGLALP